MVDQKFFIIYCNIWSEIASYVSNYKNHYFVPLVEKLGDLSRSVKTDWDTLIFLWNVKEVPNIPPSLVNNELISEFEAMANIFINM